MKNTAKENTDRRAFFKHAGILVAGAAVASPFLGLTQARSEQKKGEKAEVSPPEDLMREHGVIRRILLVYENIQGTLSGGGEFPIDVLTSSADLIHRFIENYHEKLEEDFLFPIFVKAGRTVDLVKVLRDQHHEGRRLTESIMKSVALGALKEAEKQEELADTLHMFIRMYRPHAAREDTVLFPALRTIVSAKEFDSLGEEFEEKEEKLFGEGGFQKIVAEVGTLEKTLGIYDLSQFTPPK